MSMGYQSNGRVGNIEAAADGTPYRTNKLLGSSGKVDHIEAADHSTLQSIGKEGTVRLLIKRRQSVTPEEVGRLVA